MRQIGVELIIEVLISLKIFSLESCQNLVFNVVADIVVDVDVAVVDVDVAVVAVVDIIVDIVVDDDYVIAKIVNYLNLESL